MPHPPSTETFKPWWEHHLHLLFSLFSMFTTVPPTLKEVSVLTAQFCLARWAFFHFPPFSSIQGSGSSCTEQYPCTMRSLLSPGVHQPDPGGVGPGSYGAGRGQRAGHPCGGRRGLLSGLPHGPFPCHLSRRGSRQLRAGPGFSRFSSRLRSQQRDVGSAGPQR